MAGLKNEGLQIPGLRAGNSGATPEVHRHAHWQFRWGGGFGIERELSARVFTLTPLRRKLMTLQRTTALVVGTLTVLTLTNRVLTQGARIPGGVRHVGRAVDGEGGVE